jgi:ubiquinone/menaquinone biosynthesis C-methylase UbiE
VGRGAQGSRLRHRGGILTEAPECPRCLLPADSRCSPTSQGKAWQAFVPASPQVGDVRGLRVLDAACGPGLYGAELLRLGAQLVGFDPSTPIIDRARARLGPAIDLHLAELGERLPYEDATFDRVVCALAIG